MDLLLKISGAFILLFSIVQLRKYNFYSLSNESLEFRRYWYKPIIILDRFEIIEIWICNIQGNHFSYYVYTRQREFKIDLKSIKIKEIESFAIRNHITLKQVEDSHGGSVNIIYKGEHDRTWFVK